MIHVSKDATQRIWIHLQFVEVSQKIWCRLSIPTLSCAYLKTAWECGMNLHTKTTQNKKKEAVRIGVPLASLACVVLLLL